MPTPRGDQPSTEAAASHPEVNPVVTVRTLVVSALLVLAFIALVWMLAQVAQILLLLLIAIVFAEGLRSPVERVEKGKLPRPAAVLVVYVVLLAVLVLLVTLLVSPIVSEVNTLIRQLPTYQHQVSNAVTTIQQRLHISPNQNITSQIVGSLNTAKDVLLAVSGYVAGVVINLILIMILSFLWLVSSDNLKSFVVDIFPIRQQPLAADVLREMGFRMGGYIRATAINMVVVGVASGIAATLLRLPSPVLLGIFAGLAAAIPLVGPLVGAVPAVLLGFTVAPAYPILVAIVFAVVQLLDANIVVPPLMNRVVALPALSVVLALLTGGAVAGIVGALLAIPLAAAIHVILIRVVVPAIHHSQGRSDEAFAKAATPVSPSLRKTAPTGGGRRSSPR
jgi:predicted PurR-regulated permease PerM